jgi:hypothetical protein
MAKIITTVKHSKSPRTLIQGNREWVISLNA